MKRITLLFALVCLYHIAVFGQKKYEMVIEKTDGSTIVIKTEDIARTYFREIEENNNNEGDGEHDAGIVGIWYCVVIQGGSSYTIGWRFDANGDCYYDEWGNSRTEAEWDIPAKWNTSNNILTITWTDEEGTDIDTYSYSLSDNGMTLTLISSKSNITLVFTKQ
jgi:hypothetical protein